MITKKKNLACHFLCEKIKFASLRITLALMLIGVIGVVPGRASAEVNSESISKGGIVIQAAVRCGRMVRACQMLRR